MVFCRIDPDQFGFWDDRERGRIPFDVCWPTTKTGFPLMHASTNPEIFVIASPNGAGKSTCAASILPKHFPTDKFLNADQIARALATDSPMESGRVMLQRLHELRNRGETFAFETTLAGRTYVTFLREAQESGYCVHLAYVWLSSVDLAKKRVAV